MTQNATVEQLLEGGRALIAVARQTACGHDCEKCAGCGAQGGTVRAVAIDRVGVSVGDKVVVSSDDRQILGTVALVYLPPIAGFFLGYALGSLTGHAVLHVLAAVLCTAAGCVPALVHDRRTRRAGGVRFEITRKL